MSNIYRLWYHVKFLVNNHAVICILCVCTNWMEVNYKKYVMNGEIIWDNKILNNYDWWVFFGGTLSKGEKNDHIFRHSCVTYVIKYYNNLRVGEGEKKISFNVVWTDNYPIQYKCPQKFWQIVSSGKRNNSIIIHKAMV